VQVQTKVYVAATINDNVNDDNNDNYNEEPAVNMPFHNSVLAKLSVDGKWPCPVCKYPYFLLLA